MKGYAWYVPKKKGFVNIGLGGYVKSFKASGTTIHEEFKSYLKKNPKEAEAHRLLGSAYGMQEKLGMAHYHLGKYNQMIGRWKTASIHLQKALPFITDSKLKEDIETMLKQVKKAANREAREKENQ